MYPSEATTLFSSQEQTFQTPPSQAAVLVDDVDSLMVYEDFRQSPTLSTKKGRNSFLKTRSRICKVCQFRKVPMELSPVLQLSQARRKRVSLHKPLKQREPMIPGVLRASTNLVKFDKAESKHELPDLEFKKILEASEILLELSRSGGLRSADKRIQKEKLLSDSEDVEEDDDDDFFGADADSE